MHSPRVDVQMFVSRMNEAAFGLETGNRRQEGGTSLSVRAGTVSFPCVFKCVLMIPEVSVESKVAESFGVAFTQIQDKKVNVYRVLVLSANQSLRSRSTEDPLSCCCPLLCCGHMKGKVRLEIKIQSPTRCSISDLSFPTIHFWSLVEKHPHHIRLPEGLLERLQVLKQHEN